MPNILQLLPMLEPDEMVYVQGIVKDMNDTQAQQFASVYMNRRKDTTMILVATVIGFFGVAGVQRFLTNQTGMGLLYLFTLGFCFIGTIIDLVNFRAIALEYNVGVAQQSALLVKSIS
ncbi:MAG: TM2 domain-containing protein [Bacteriovoracaceae bacterium]|nr:TM2 domain-containing protein [Bacteroidota bacterium]